MKRRTAYFRTTLLDGKYLPADAMVLAQKSRTD
jgi:hypothetical protein